MLCGCILGALHLYTGRRVLVVVVVNGVDVEWRRRKAVGNRIRQQRKRERRRGWHGSSTNSSQDLFSSLLLLRFSYTFALV